MGGNKLDDLKVSAFSRPSIVRSRDLVLVPSFVEYDFSLFYVYFTVYKKSRTSLCFLLASEK